MTQNFPIKYSFKQRLNTGEHKKAFKLDKEKIYCFNYQVYKLMY